MEVFPPKAGCNMINITRNGGMDNALKMMKWNCDFDYNNMILPTQGKMQCDMYYLLIMMVMIMFSK